MSEYINNNQKKYIIIINRNTINSIIKRLKKATLAANKAYVKLNAMKKQLKENEMYKICAPE